MNDGTCRNCGAALAAADRYCAACGQKRIVDADRRLPALARASLAEISDVDGRLLPSLWALVFRPGFLSREYRMGRRRRYLSPIALFLFANLVFFLAPTITDLNLVFYDQYTMQPYSEWMRPTLDAAMASRDMTLEEFGAAYDARIGDLAKSMVIAHVPLIALATLLLTFRKGFYYADHIVAALHFFAFLMLYYALIPYTLRLLVAGINLLPYVTVPLRAATIVLLLAYMLAMMRGAFDLKWPTAVALTPPFLLGFIGAHYVYRLLQLCIGLALV